MRGADDRGEVMLKYLIMEYIQDKNNLDTVVELLREFYKTDESVEICRNQANSNMKKNPCKWRGYAACRGFCYC